MNQTVVVAVGLALVSAPSAVASGLPSVPVPSVPLPPVPTVVAPVPVPTVVAPVPVPTVVAPPAVPPQLPTVPAAGGLVSSGSVSSGSATGGATTPRSANNVSRAAPLGSGGRSAPTSSARSGRTSAASGGSASSRATGRSRLATAAAAAHRRAVRRERRLRQVVGRLRGCLDGLPVLERRVLILRAGVGPGDPRSRARVARATDLSTRRVARLERRGLRRLRGLARGGCGMSARSDDPVAIVRVSAPIVPGFARALVAAAAFGGHGTDRIEVKGEQRSSKPSGGAGTTPELASPAGDPKELAPPGAVMKLPKDSRFLLVAALLLLAMVVVGFVVEARRSVRPR